MRRVGKVIKIKIPYEPSILQQEIHRDMHRFRVLDCGRRFGKTWWLVNECNQMGLDVWQAQKTKARIWIVAPTFPLVKETWRVANELLKDAILDKRETDLWMDFPWCEMEFKSAERGDEGLRGAGLDAVGIDEAARVDREAWEYGLRPALADRQGRAVFISTPHGQNWFYDLYLEGITGSDNVKSWKFSTIEGWRTLYKDNPKQLALMEAEWAEICKKTPEMILKQEYLAEFLEDESTVFHRLNKCIGGSFEPPIEGERYVIGIDLAKTVDFSVFSVIKLYDNQLVCVERFNEVSWAYQKRRIIDLHNRYNKAKVVIDSTGLGDPILEDLTREGVYATGYKFNATTKQEMVEEMMVVIEQGMIRIPDEAVDTLHELRIFEYEVLPTTGRIRYSAPDGKHDDAVTSLGLAIMGMRHEFDLRRPEKREEKDGMTFGEYVAIHENRDKQYQRYPQLIAQGID